MTGRRVPRGGAGLLTPPRGDGTNPALAATRTIVVRTTIVAFSIAAALGIAVLLLGRTFGDAQVKVILTTAIVGTTSVAGLCYLTTAGTRRRGLGVLGATLAVASAVLAIVLVWWNTSEGDVLSRLVLEGTTLAATLAQICLLLVAMDRAPRTVRRIGRVACAAAVVVAAMLSPAWWWDDLDPPGWYWRTLGTAAILDALASIVVLALSRFGPQAADAPALSPPREVHLPDDLRRRVDAYALAEGRRPDDVIAEAVAHHMDAVADRAPDAAPPA